MVSASAPLSSFRWVTSLFLVLLVMVQLMGSGAAADRPRAFVWLGPKDDPDLSEAVGQLLKSSPHNFQVAYVGPKDITADSLKTVKLLAFPGGADVDNLWKVLKPVAQPIRSFVAGGGRYVGFCLGAYIAGHSPGLGLLPNGTDVSAECDEEDAQVRDDRDTVIQIHWAFSSGSSAGKMATDRWIYYQEGNFVENFVEDNTSYVLGRYSKTDRVAATLNKYGEGWVGTIGPHPEADQSWFDLANITAPDGLQTEIGHDLINTVMSGGSNVTSLAASRPANGTEPKPSTTTVPGSSTASEPKPSITTEPEPTATTEPNASTTTESRPWDTTEPKQSTTTELKSSDTAEPKPSDTTKPQPSEGTEPKSSDATKSSGEAKPSDATKSSGATKPSDTPKPSNGPTPKVVSSGGSRLNNPFRRLFRR